MSGEVDRFQHGAALAMLLGDWSAGDGPLYRKLADAVARAVDDGSLVAGERLPAERELSRVLAVSRATVVAAYEDLRGRGVVDRRQGSGTRVNGRRRIPRSDGRVRGGQGTAIVQRLIDGPGRLISLGCAADAGVPEVAEALRAVADHDITELLRDAGYHPRGLPALREAVAHHYTTQGLPTSPEQVLVTTGAHQALVLLAEVYLRGASAVAVEVPSWAPCLDIFRQHGVRLVPVGLDDEGVDVHALAEALTGTTPALLYVMPTFHNPTGRLMSAARRRQVAELAARHGVAVVEDHAYAGHSLTVDETALPAPLAAYAPESGEVLTVESLKGIWAGLRVGWVRGPAGIIERCARRKAMADLGSPLIEQAVAARLVPRLAELSRARCVVQRRQLAELEHLLRQRLPEWTWTTPDGGSSLWVRLPGGHSADVYAQLALRHGVEVVPGSTMDPTGQHDGYFRIPFVRPLEELAELVSRLASAWTELVRHGPHEDLPLRPVV
ncbi:aminotransferase-like domain-containing protein [Saccharomonospora cyanea]|uniref:Transcriptional regulator with HTH domain and aminotransferase domain n=1 Tax=Saccharomonospora cyanea NA-134 TaxID=882082 RepID=H5XI65_9PSEU|nr:PLP-dependent aminotransferase family protein [Saccharomonospora cyanea]EHR60695.1 transcriptional regulator with HTH domain and aminotransferase domain [Saccharomonospora cyanea NA-134]